MAVDLPALQEAILIGNLRGDSQLINLTEVSAMGDEERKNHEHLRDLGTLLLDPKTIKVVNGVEDLMRFCSRVHFSVDRDDLVALKSWHPNLEEVFANTVWHEYPERYHTLTLAFRG